MKFVEKADIPTKQLPARVLQNAVGVDASIPSSKMSVGFARYSAESGPMEPHRHAEETVIVLESVSGRVRYGSAPDNLEHHVKLEKDMVLHFDELEWHVFEYEEGGEIEIIFIYGQVDNIRPEQILDNVKKS